MAKVLGERFPREQMQNVYPTFMETIILRMWNQLASQHSHLIRRKGGGSAFPCVTSAKEGCWGEWNVGRAHGGSLGTASVIHLSSGLSYPLRYTYLWWHTCWYGDKVQLLQNHHTYLLVSSSLTLNVLAGQWQRNMIRLRPERPGFDIPQELYSSPPRGLRGPSSVQYNARFTCYVFVKIDGRFERHLIRYHRLFFSHNVFQTECAFGTLNSEWRTFHGPSTIYPDFSEVVVKACELHEAESSLWSW
jgi:hypothetical protein